MEYRFVEDKTIYVVGLYPSPETDETNMDFMWWTYLALSWTYGCNVVLAKSPQEVPNLHALPYIAVEQKTHQSTALKDFIHPPAAVYLVGNSKWSHPSYWAKADMAIHLDVPYVEHPLYGCQAAAIVLNDRYIQNASI